MILLTVSDAPLYISFPHFLKADPALLNAVEGLSPDVDKHESFIKINSVSWAKLAFDFDLVQTSIGWVWESYGFCFINFQKLGVPLEARARVQLNIMVEQSNIHVVRQFPSMVFPVMWLEEVNMRFLSIFEAF